jgi:serine/threonine-protein kinase
MRVTLKVVKGPHFGAEFSFDQYASFVVGRHRRSQFHLSLKDPYLSRLHFYVEIKPPRCVVVDLGSSNHTYVNGRKVDERELADGDLVKAGKTTLQVAIEPGGRAAEATAVDPDSAALVPGFRLVQRLGAGNTGAVYLAVDERDEARVAIKLIAPAIAHCPRSKAIFEREAVILRQLSHPHIVALYDVGIAGPRPYLVMEYAPGPDALHLMATAGGRLPVGRAVDLACQTLEALGHAHRAGIVHRDVKPNNLLVARIGGRNVVKLGDFGLARIYRESSISGLTVDGDVRGTIGYLPPEHIHDLRNVGPPADLYGVGATLFSLLTGELPYDFPERANDCFHMILHEDPRPIRAVCPEVPEGLAVAIHRALAREPKDRYPDADAMRQALAPWAEPGGS